MTRFDGVVVEISRFKNTAFCCIFELPERVAGRSGMAKMLLCFSGADPPFIAATLSPNPTVGNFARRPDASSRLFWPLLPRAAWKLPECRSPRLSLISISGPYSSASRIHVNCPTVPLVARSLSHKFSRFLAVPQPESNLSRNKIISGEGRQKPWAFKFGLA